MVPHCNSPRRAKGESHKWLFKHPGRDGKHGPEEPEEGIPRRTESRGALWSHQLLEKGLWAEAELSLCISMDWKGEAAWKAQPRRVWILTTGGRRILVEFTKLRWAIFTFLKIWMFQLFLFAFYQHFIFVCVFFSVFPSFGGYDTVQQKQHFSSWVKYLVP